MKKPQLSASETRLLLLLLGLVMLAAAYFFGFQRNVDAAQALEEQNEVDRQTVAELEEMQSRQALVEKETEELKQQIQDIIAKYPSDLTTEKAIKILTDMEQISGITMSNIGFVMNTLLMDLQPEAAEATTDTTTDTAEATDTGDAASAEAAPESPVVEAFSEGAPIGYYATLTVNFTAPYDGFKKMVQYINELDDRSTIPQLSVSYDTETSGLIGSATINMYFLTGTDKEYVPPVINGMPKGVDDIFQSGGGIYDLLHPAAEGGNAEGGNAEGGNATEGGNAEGGSGTEGAAGGNADNGEGAEGENGANGGRRAA